MKIKIQFPTGRTINLDGLTEADFTRIYKSEGADNFHEDMLIGVRDGEVCATKWMGVDDGSTASDWL